MAPGSKASVIAMQQRAHAQDLRIPAFDTLDELADWLACQRKPITEMAAL